MTVAVVRRASDAATLRGLTPAVNGSVGFETQADGVPGSPFRWRTLDDNSGGDGGFRRSLVTRPLPATHYEVFLRW